MQSHTITAKTLFDLIRQNNVVFNTRGSNCRVYKIKYQTSNQRFLFFAKCKESYSSPLGHIVGVKFDHEEKSREVQKPLNTDCKLFCSCPAFQYWGPAYNSTIERYSLNPTEYRDWETDRKSTRLNSSHSGESRMPSSA